MEGEAWLRLIGGAFLIALGDRIFLKHPAEHTPSIRGSGLIGAYASTFFLTLTNPTTILSFAAIFAGLGAGSEIRDHLSAAFLVLGVFLGSALWWLLLSGGVGLFRAKVTTHGLRWINRLSGTIVAMFGLLAILGFGE